MVTAGVLAALAITAWVVKYRLMAHDPTWATVFPVIVLAVLALTIAAPGRREAKGPPAAEGRVVVVIPAFNESPDALHRTIRSLLAGTRVPDEIHVIDDGSDMPIPALEHPRVSWYRQPNGGKRKAQERALRGVGEVDFIVTVDSDCTIDRRAIERLLQAMSDGEVQAATGLPLTRNRTGWLPRVIDLEIASICLSYRAARSMLGSLTTCSGALSIYRAEVVLDNLDDYVSDALGSGDDRRLTHYAMLRGKVVSVSGAVAHTDMPTRLRQLYRQRIRWSTSHWRYTPWEVAHLPTHPMLWTCYHLVLSVVVPLGLFWTLVLAPILGNGFAWEFLAYWSVIVWLTGIKYAVGRPHMAPLERWSTWLLGTPLLILLQILVLRPAMLHALFKTRSGTWGTRATRVDRGRYRRVNGRYKLAA